MLENTSQCERKPCRICVRKEKNTSTIHRKDLVSQSDYLTGIYSLSGGMYSGTTDNNIPGIFL